MKMIVQTPDFKATDKLLEFAQAHVDKLETFTDRAVECRVLLKLDKSDTKENKIAEIKVVIPGNDLFASRNSETFEEAISKCTDALKRQIERWKNG